MAVIGSLSVKLGLVTVEWDQATAKAKAQAKDLQKSFNDLTGELKTLYTNFKLLGGVTSASALGLAELMHSTLEFSNEVKDLAAAYDISIGKTLQFSDAIATSGGNADQAGRMLSTLFAKIGEAQQGNETAIYYIEKLGISFSELRDLKPEDAIGRIAEGLGNIANQAEKTKIIREIFGRAGVTVNFAEVAEKVKKSSDSFETHAAAIKKFGETADNIKTSLANLKIAFADLVSPFVGEGLISVEKFKAAFLAIASVAAVQNFAKIVTLAIELRNAIAAGASITAVMTGNVVALGAALVGLGVYFGSSTFFSDPIKRLNNELDIAKERLKELQNPTGWSKKLQNLFGTSPSPAAIAEQEQIIKNLEAKLLPAQTKVTEEVKKTTEQDKRGSDAVVAKIQLQQKMLVINGKINDLKLLEINNDKFSIQQAINEQNLAADKAKALAILQESNAKGIQSNAEKANATKEYNVSIAEAQQKYIYANKTLEAQRDKEYNDTVIKVQLQKEMFALDEQGYALKRTALTTGAYEIQIAEAKLNTQKQITQLEQDYALKTKNITDAKTLEGMAIKNEQDLNEKRKEGQATLDLIVATKNKDIAVTELQIKFAKEINQMDIAKLKLEDQKYYMTQYEYDKQSEMLTLNQKLATIEQQRQDATLKMGKGELLDEENKRLDKQIELEKDLSAARMVSVDLQERQRTSFTEGWDKAFRTYAENAKNYSNQGAQAFSLVTNTMDKAITDFVNTGKFAFGDFVKTIIKGLITIQLQMQATKLLSGAASGIGGFVGSMFSVGGGAVDGGIPAAPMLMKAAGGGDIYAGQPTLVGEKGPEMIVPARNGVVIPNNQLGSSMSQPQNVYNGPYIANMSAIDTQSATDFLAKNKMTIWAVNQSANRSIPTSR